MSTVCSDEVKSTLRPVIDALVPWPHFSIPEEEVAEQHLLKVGLPLDEQHFPGGDGHLPQEEHRHRHKNHAGWAFLRHGKCAVQAREEGVHEGEPTTAVQSLMRGSR